MIVSVTDGATASGGATLLDNAVLVVAHPDDEVLWFSSVVRGVREIIFCFLDHERNPLLGPARRSALARYPMAHHTALGVPEAGTFNTVDWTAPVETDSGLALSGADAATTTRYLDNAKTLRALLTDAIHPYTNVITHNPWGEYGHPDHVQVYRVLSAVTRALQRDLWFSNYVSNISLPLHLRYVSGFNSRYTSLATDPALGRQVAEIYKSERCWTWYDDFEWFPQESFVTLSAPTPSTDPPKPYGSLYPVNLIRVSPEFRLTPDPPPSRSLLGQLRSAWKHRSAR